MSIRPAVLILLALLSAGCGLSRTARIEDRMEHAGVKPQLARCLAPKLADKLSDDELEKIAQAVKRPGEDGSRLKLRAMSERLAGLDDQRILDVVSRAGLACTILG